MKTATAFFACSLASLTIALAGVCALELGGVEGFSYRSGYVGLSVLDGFFHALHNQAAVMAVVVAVATVAVFPMVLVVAWWAGLWGERCRRRD